MDLDLVALERTLERDDRLDQERVGVLEVQVHDGHHSYTHHLRLEESLDLFEIVLVDGGCDELGFFRGSQLGRLDVFKGRHVCGSWSVLILRFDGTVLESRRHHTLFLIDLVIHVGVDGGNNHVRDNIAQTNVHQDLRVLKRDSLGDLHHPKDDDQVGSAESGQYQAVRQWGGRWYI